MIKHLTIFLFLFLTEFPGLGQNLKPTPIEVESEIQTKPRPVGLILFAEGPLKLSWFAPINQVGTAYKWSKLEYGIQVPEIILKQIKVYLTTGNDKLGQNPYDPEQMDCFAEFTAPSGKVTRVNGFYYQPKLRDWTNQSWMEDTTSYPWRVRFAPDEVGEWDVNFGFQSKQGGENYYYNNVKSTFTCKPSNHKGRLIYHKGDSYYRYSETDSTYFSVGGTVAHSDYYNLSPKASIQHIKWLDQLGSSKANYFRLELSGRNGLPDFDNAVNYSSRQDEMWEFDKYVDKAEQHKMYFTMFRHHIEVMDENTWDVVKWNNNPYRKMFNLTSRVSYFEDKNVLKQQQKCLRYIFARWGYTPYLAFYGYTELDGWFHDMIEKDGKTWQEAETIFSGWLDSNINFIRDKTHFSSGLFACGYESNVQPDILTQSKVFPLCDMIPLHSYQYVKWGNYKEIYNYISAMEKSFPNIPIQMEEVGQNIPSYCCTDVEFHNCLWSNSMMNISGVPNHWWWDRGIHYQEYYKQYEHVSLFFEDEDLNSKNYSKQRWSDKSGPVKYQYKAKLENLAMVSEDQTRALGWIHNATYYWRNLEQINPCIADLVDNGRFDSLVCKLESEVKPGSGDEDLTVKDNYLDYYTNNGGTIDIISEMPMGENPTFVISGLKGNGNKAYNPWAKNHWYRISYYPTRGAVSAKPVFTQVFKTNSVGKLKPNVPNLDASNPDYSYKVEYLGKSAKAPK